MNTDNLKQDQLDELFQQQLTVQSKLDDLEIAYRQFKVIREEVMASQGSAVFHFKDLLTVGITQEHLQFYDELLQDIEETTRFLDADFEEEDSVYRQQHQKYDKELENLSEVRKSLERDEEG